MLGYHPSVHLFPHFSKLETETSLTYLIKCPQSYGGKGLRATYYDKNKGPTTSNNCLAPVPCKYSPWRLLALRNALTTASKTIETSYLNTSFPSLTSTVTFRTIYWEKSKVSPTGKHQTCGFHRYQVGYKWSLTGNFTVERDSKVIPSHAEFSTTFSLLFSTKYVLL